MLQPGLSVQWRACSQALFAIANVKRSLLQYNTLMVSFPPQTPSSHPLIIAAAPVPLPSATASSRHSPSPHHPAQAEATAGGAAGFPMTPVSVIDLEDASSSSRDASALDGGGHAPPAASDDFLSQLFGEKEAQKIFQPFL
jgi:hypothetical protein